MRLVEASTVMDIDGAEPLVTDWPVRLPKPSIVNDCPQAVNAVPGAGGSLEVAVARRLSAS